MVAADGESGRDRIEKVDRLSVVSWAMGPAAAWRVRESFMRRSEYIRAHLALLLALAVCAGSCDRTPDRPSPPAGAKSVLLVLIDTLRADKLGCYGSSGDLTPRIDRFAEQGFVFEKAFSHAPWTLPSVSSLLTSTYPCRHGAGARLGNAFRFTGVSREVRTLAECFGDQGYDTGAIVNVLFLDPKFGVARGFEHYDYLPPSRDQRQQRVAKQVTDLAIRWIEGRSASSSRPFFLMVHYFDPHLTYDPPAEFRRRFALQTDHERDDGLFGSESDMVAFRRGEILPASLPLTRLRRLYEAEIAYTDREVGRLLDAVSDQRLEASTVVAITADHGEEFLDHGEFEHGHTVYDELIHVPLIFRDPGIVAPGRSRVAVGHVDVAPTLCRLAGVRPEDTFQGHGLSPHLFGEAPLPRSILSQGNMWGPSLTSWRADGFKLIEKPGGFELYDVVRDPRGRVDLARKAAARGRLDRMKKDLAQAVKLIQGAGGLRVDLTENDKRILKGLGYVAGED